MYQITWVWAVCSAVVGPIEKQASEITSGVVGWPELKDLQRSGLALGEVPDTNKVEGFPGYNSVMRSK